MKLPQSDENWLDATQPGRSVSRSSSALLLAFACDPDKGSEPGAGWAMLRVLTEMFDEVTVITSSEAPADLASQASKLPARVSVHVARSRWDQVGNVYFRYLGWLRSAARTLATQLGSVDFDVLQHATFASDWLPSPIALVRRSALAGVRVIWGPVGGATYPPIALASTFGVRFLVKELARNVVTRSIRAATLPLHRRRVDLAIAMNPDTAHALRRMRAVAVRANAVLDAGQLPTRASTPDRTVVFGARGLDWKGVSFALAMAEFLPSEWQVHMFGRGTDAERYRRQVPSSGAIVVFHGAAPRQEYLAAVASSTALLMPSLHDSAGWAAAEASTIGVPVVCLALGGVPGMAGANAVVVSHSDAAAIPKLMAEAVLGLPSRGQRASASGDWSLSSQVQFLEACIREL